MGRTWPVDELGPGSSTGRKLGSAAIRGIVFVCVAVGVARGCSSVGFLEVLIELLQDLVVGVFLGQALQSRFVDLGVVVLGLVEVGGVAKLHDGFLEFRRSLGVGVGVRGAVTAVDFGLDGIFVNVDVLLDVFDGLVVIGLAELVGLDDGALEGGVAVGIAIQSIGGSNLAAAGLVLQQLFVRAAVDDGLAFAFGEGGVG